MNIVSDQDVAELYQPEKGNIPCDFGHDNTLNLCDTYTQDDNDYDFLEWNDPDKNYILIWVYPHPNIIPLKRQEVY